MLSETGAWISIRSDSSSADPIEETTGRATLDNAATDDVPLVGLRAFAAALLGVLQTTLRRNGITCPQPLVGVDDDEIVFEWRSGERHLTVFVTEDFSVEILRSWGANIHREMATFSAPTTEQVLDSWRWLEHGE